jgi:MOSC domain-containing protein YiiM
MEQMAQVVSINVGLLATSLERQKVHTAIWKQPVQGRIAARRLNLEGDGQGGSRRGRRRTPGRDGLSNRRYRYWETQLSRNDFRTGSSARTLP